MSSTANIEAEELFLGHIGNLTIQSLWNHDDPIALLENRLGFTVHFAARPRRTSYEAHDLIIQHPDTGWHALRLGAYGHNNQTLAWDEKPYRLLILYAAFSEPVTHSAATPDALLHQLVDGCHGTYEATDGDDWVNGVFINFVLETFLGEDREAHETLIALKSPLLLDNLQRLRNWYDNTEDDDWEGHAMWALARAMQHLWPVLHTRNQVPDTDMAHRLLDYPRTEWDLRAEEMLRAAATDRSSTTYRALRVQWVNVGRVEFDFCPSVLAAITTPPRD